MCAGVVAWVYSSFVKRNNFTVTVQGFQMSANMASATVAFVSSFFSTTIANFVLPLLTRALPVGFTQFLQNAAKPIGAGLIGFGLSYVPGLDALVTPGPFAPQQSAITQRLAFGAEIAAADFAGGIAYDQFKKPLLSTFLNI